MPHPSAQAACKPTPVADTEPVIVPFKKLKNPDLTPACTFLRSLRSVFVTASFIPLFAIASAVVAFLHFLSVATPTCAFSCVTSESGITSPSSTAPSSRSTVLV